MRKQIISLLIFCLPLIAFSNNKLDNSSKIFLANYKSAAQKNNSCKRSIPNKLHTTRDIDDDASVVSALITLNNNQSLCELDAYNISIIATAGDMALISGNLEDLIAVSESTFVKAFSFGGNEDPLLDKARQSSSIQQAHNGETLPASFKGTGVICGIFDHGLDPNHINFYNSDLSSTRIKSLFHFNGRYGSSISYTSAEEIASFTTDKKSTSHGTHTLGCMAGGFNLAPDYTSGIEGSYAYIFSPSANKATITSARKFPFYGSAPEADIVACCGEFYDANIIGAVSKIINYAKEAAQPAVINLSIGAILGPRDGSDATARFLNNQASDAVIFVSAGNDGDKKVSISQELSPEKTSICTLLGPSGDISGVVDIWSSTSSPFVFSPVIVDKTTGKIVFRYDCNEVTESALAIVTKTYDDDSFIYNDVMDEAFEDGYFQFSTSNNSATNNRYSCQLSFDFVRNKALNPSGNLVPGIIIAGEAGSRIDIAMRTNNAEFASMGIDGWEDGNGSMTINNLACGNNIISVGAYTSADKWPTLNGNIYKYTIGNYELDKVCEFSSYGKTVNGRTLPDVYAPGASIISSYSKDYIEANNLSNDNISGRISFNGRNSYWVADQGTSMASPIAAGIAALWLEADPTLTPDKILEVINATSDNADTASTENNAPTARKINAAAGLKYILKQAGLQNITPNAERAIITPKASNVYEVFIPGKNMVSVNIYNTSGQLVSRQREKGDTILIDTNNLHKGIYILNVDDDGNTTRRIIVN